ncbi:MAG TPA: diacylglycerol kinase family protein [Terriglobales bacterium]
MPASATEVNAILVFGGDGTVHRHLPQLVKLGVPVLIVPCGSGNDFARSLKLRNKRDSLAAWRRFVARAANVRTIDLGKITEASADSRSNHPATTHYFCCVAGVGLDTEVARAANRLPAWLRGHGGYALSIPGALLRFAPFPMKLLEADGGGSWFLRSDVPISLVAFANGPFFGGGMKIAPEANMEDGKLDVCLVRGTNPFKLVWMFPTIYFGRHLELDPVQYFKAERARVETEHRLDVYADGEYVCHTPIEIGTVARALPVIV